MNLTMANCPMTVQAESPDSQKLDGRLKREKHPKPGEESQGQIPASRRAAFRFLLFIAVLFVINCHLPRLKEIVNRCRIALASTGSHSTIRQAAVDYENQLDEITK